MAHLVGGPEPELHHSEGRQPELRRGHYELGVDARHDRLRLAAAFAELSPGLRDPGLEHTARRLVEQRNRPCGGYPLASTRQP